MFRKLIDQFRPKHLKDPTFGDLRFMKMKHPSTSYWEGRGLFEPVGVEIEYLIHGGENGPGESQRLVFQRIAANYSSLLGSIAPILRREYQECIGQPPPSDVFTAFQLDGLTIPCRESPTMEWDLDFSCVEGEDYLFTVFMVGWQPTGKVSVMH